MGTAQLEYTADELLADPNFVDPLVVGGTVCHGGFGDDGAYVSPRARNRVTDLLVFGFAAAGLAYLATFLTKGSF